MSNSRKANKFTKKFAGKCVRFSELMFMVRDIQHSKPATTILHNWFSRQRTVEGFLERENSPISRIYLPACFIVRTDGDDFLLTEEEIKTFKIINKTKQKPFSIQKWFSDACKKFPQFVVETEIYIGSRM